MVGHHHRSAFEKQKPFKAKSKGKQKRLQKGRVGSSAEGLKSSGAIDRSARINLSKQIRDNKTVEAARRKHLAGSSLRQPPKIIALVPVHERANVRLIRDRLAIANGVDEKDLPQDDTPLTINCVDGSRKFRLTLVQAHPNMLSILDAAKVADVLVPVLCPFHSVDARDAYGMNEASDAFIAAVKAQGLPAVLAIAQGLSDVPPKHLHIVRKTCIRYVHTMFDDKVKMLPGDASDDYRSIIRHLNNLRLKELQFRNVRPYLLADSMRFTPTPNDPDQTGTMVLTGIVRGVGELSPNNLVHITGLGDFQVDRIDFQLQLDRRSSGSNAMDTGDCEDSFQTVEADASKRESLVGLHELDPLANEQSIITEEEMREAEASRHANRIQELMSQGVQEYQAAWEAVLPSDDDDDDDDDDDADALALPDAAMHDDPDEADHAKLALKFRMEREEMEFPDEVDTPTDLKAKVRFQRYRGLKSFASSPWDANENLPLEYGCISRFQNFDATCKRVLRATAAATAGTGIVAGARVAVHVARVPASGAAALAGGARSCVLLSALLPHERSVSVCHCKVRRSAAQREPVRSKQRLLWCVGFRRSEAAAVFSVDSVASDKHKVERFLHAQRFSVASMYARVTLGPAPVLALQPRTHTLVAAGALLPPAPDRINVKRIVLTGYPIRVHKRRAVVRYMFFSPDDVRWFQPVQLTTKYGLVGQIDEPVGTHGYFKCSFNGFIKPHDTVCLVLYKRQFPPWDAHAFAGAL